MMVDMTTLVQQAPTDTTLVPRGTWARVARVYWLAVSLVAIATLSLSMYLSITWEGNGGALNGVIFTLSYFTVWSNVVTLIANLMLAADPARDGSAFRWLRMSSLVMITITGLVYALVLAPLGSPIGPEVWTNLGYHYICPWATVAGFLLFGPRPRFTIKQVWLMLIIPVVWLTYTMLRGLTLVRPPGNRPDTQVGPPQNWYPYPFLDVNDPSPLVPGIELGGYAGVAVNMVLILALGLLFGFIYLGLDRLLSGGRRPSAGRSARA